MHIGSYTISLVTSHQPVRDADGERCEFHWPESFTLAADHFADEHKELNNELVVPMYRQFCVELNIPFHFWDQLPDRLQPEL